MRASNNKHRGRPRDLDLGAWMLARIRRAAKERRAILADKLKRKLWGAAAEDAAAAFALEALAEDLERELRRDAIAAAAEREGPEPPADAVPAELVRDQF